MVVVYGGVGLDHSYLRPDLAALAEDANSSSSTSAGTDASGVIAVGTAVYSEMPAMIANLEALGEQDAEAAMRAFLGRIR